MQDLTPEELETIREMLAARAGTPGSPTEAYSGLPQAQPAAASAPPSPYEAQANAYKAKADSLDTQAATPYPQPQGTKQSIVAGLRNGMESFGRLGAPGGTEGQEALRQKNFADQAKTRIEQAKALRGQAQDQQDLGQRTAYQSAEVQNQKDTLDQTKTFESGQLDNQKVTEQRLQQTANNPVGNDIPQGGRRVFTDPHTGREIPGTALDGPDKPTPGYNLETKVVDEGGGKFGYHAFDMRNGGKDVGRMGDAPAPGAGGSGGGPLGLVQSSITGADGNPTPGVLSLRSNTFTPAHLAGDPDQKPLQTAAAGNANVRAQVSNAVDLNGAERLLAGMNDTLNRIKSGKSTAIGADDMNLLSSHIAMTFGTVKGARTGKDLIEAHMKARDLGDAMQVLMEKVTNGGQLSPGQREEFAHLAQQRVEEMRNSRGDLKAGMAADFGTAPAGNVVKYDNKGNRIP